VADALALRLPVDGAQVTVDSVVFTDESNQTKWRTWDDQETPIGRARRTSGTLIFAVAPSEWMVIGSKPEDTAIDLTHVRAMIRVSGIGSRRLMTHVCALDLSDSMTPNGSAARTLLAGVATELVRDDNGDELSYLLLMSRSFARSVWDRLVALAERLD